jgi:DNA-binding transcriptional ArsR family regulator
MAAWPQLDKAWPRRPSHGKLGPAIEERQALVKPAPQPKPHRLPGQDAPNDEQVDGAVRLLSLLADETRLRLLWALSFGEFDVKTLVRMGGSSKTSTSQHLARLREADLVTVRREGRRAIYRARSSHVRKLLKQALYQADHQVSRIPPHD